MAAVVAVAVGVDVTVALIMAMTVVLVAAVVLAIVLVVVEVVMGMAVLFPRQNMKTGQTSPFLGFTKKSSILPRVVWTEESKNDLRFEIGPSYDDVPTTSKCASDGQSSRMSSPSHRVGSCLWPANTAIVAASTAENVMTLFVATSGFCSSQPPP